MTDQDGIHKSEASREGIDTDACRETENTADREQKTKGHVERLYMQKTLMSSTGSLIMCNIGAGYKIWDCES